MTPDHSYVRAHWTCPLCLGSKDKDMLVCWPCHTRQKHLNGGCYSKDVEAKIQDFDDFLKDMVQR